MSRSAVRSLNCDFETRALGERSFFRTESEAAVLRGAFALVFLRPLRELADMLSTLEAGRCKQRLDGAYGDKILLLQSKTKDQFVRGPFIRHGFGIH